MTAREGLAAIMRQIPDLVLCDVSLPFMSGIDVLERLTEVAPGFGYMPFVFLTALGDHENELKSRRLGADGLCHKTGRLRCPRRHRRCALGACPAQCNPAEIRSV